MSNEPLVSIIIPTYNRAHLIIETLDSLLAQTYQNWECIIVDDGSSDNTDEVVADYLKKDSRFRYFNRPDEHLSGGNGARNYGLEKMSGSYFIFFDSDDLMVNNHIAFKLNKIQEEACDFVITKTEYFNTYKSCNNNYQYFEKYKITPFNYIDQKVNWLTLDVCIRSAIVDGIRFNEKLQSGQEFNFFSKLVLKTVNAKYFAVTLSLRRFHEDSVRSLLKTESSINESAFNAYWHTYLDIRSKNEIQIKRVLLKKCVSRIYLEKRILCNPKHIFIFVILKEFPIHKFFWFLLLIFSILFLNKGFYFRNKFLS